MHPMTKYQLKQLWRNIKRQGCMFAFIGIFAVVVGVCVATEYNHEESVTATVKSINTRLDINTDKDGLSNSTTTYLVGTDQGVYKIQPDGLMASPAFGLLETGKTYNMKVRGFRYPSLGIFPYIIEAEEAD